MIYSIVDIETTGGYASGNRIIEIAIFRFDGINILDQYHSLINPETRIPGFITSLTGITDDMVKDAPTFGDIAQKIFDFTSDTIFVAHNVNFDFTFIKKEFASLGIKYERQKLCTVRLSRRIFPELPSYSLGSLCGQVGIKIKDRHRAKGDAEATVDLFHLLLKCDSEKFILKSLKKNSRETLIPAYVPREHFDALPDKPGVYYFKDRKGKVVYVGKAINLKKRVISHFSAKQQSKQSQNFIKDVYGISFDVCGNELIALLLESYQIKKHRPTFNRSQKSVKLNYGIYKYEDLEGYLRLCIGNVKKNQQPLVYFRYMTDARRFLADKIEMFRLCAKLAGLQSISGACTHYEEGGCEGACLKEEGVANYNIKALEAIATFCQDRKSYIIKGEGRNDCEYSIVMVHTGKYLGFGYVPAEIPLTSFQAMRTYINGHWDNQDVQKILESYLRAGNTDSIFFFEEEPMPKVPAPVRSISQQQSLF